MYYSPREYAMIAAGLLVICLIVVSMIRRGLYKQFPFFFAYNIYHIVQEIIDTTYVTVTPADDTFFYVFYSLQLISVSLSIAVLYELFQSVLGPYDALRNVSGKLFVWMSLALLILAAVFAVFGPGTEAYRLFRVVYLSERSLRIVQLGLLICLVAVSRSLALSWRTYCFGIALGYGIYASVDLVVTVVKLKYVNFGLHQLSLVSSVAFIGMCVIWAWYVLQPQRVAQPVRIIPYNDIAKWNEKLEELLKRKAA
jgi:hypothetical protein